MKKIIGKLSKFIQPLTCLLLFSWAVTAAGATEQVCSGSHSLTALFEKKNHEAQMLAPFVFQCFGFVCVFLVFFLLFKLWAISQKKSCESPTDGSMSK